jgi:cytochrome P450
MSIAGELGRYTSQIDHLTWFKVGLGLSFLLGIYQFYLFALPKPISGIPHREASARSLLGDVPVVLSGLSRKPELRVSFNERARSLGARIVQIFPGPLTPPIVLLDDAREALDIMLYRSRDFDRTPMVGIFLSWVIPNHHSIFPSGPKWRNQRKLIQTMMTDQYLDNVAAPAIHATNLELIKLWATKEKIADGRAFSAFRDIEICTLDAMLAMTFGDTAPSGTKIQVEKAAHLHSSDNGHGDKESNKDGDIYTFPHVDVDPLTDSFSKIQRSVDWTTSTLFPSLVGWFMRRNPILIGGFRKIHAFIHQSIDASIQCLGEKGAVPHVGADHIVFREKALSDEEDRPPQFHSSAVRDEVSGSTYIPAIIDCLILIRPQIFGFLLFGNHTTRTTLAWAVKQLADNQTAQCKLRKALKASFPSATKEGRVPTASEIRTARVPYLDATIEEILRLQPIVEVGRSTVHDAPVLGRVIPKGTIVLTLNQGAGVMYPLYDTKVHDSHSAQLAKRWESYGTIDEDTAQIFAPERWLIMSEDHVEGESFNPTACYCLAFGAGVRGCWGRRLAYLQIRFFLAMLVWSYEFRQCPESLSGYQAVEGIVRVPDNCFVRLSTVSSDV